MCVKSFSMEPDAHSDRRQVLLLGSGVRANDSGCGYLRAEYNRGQTGAVLGDSGCGAWFHQIQQQHLNLSLRYTSNLI